MSVGFHFPSRDAHLDALLKSYHEQLMGHLSRLGHPESVYPHDQFVRDYTHSMGYGLYFGILSMQVGNNT